MSPAKRHKAPADGAVGDPVLIEAAAVALLARRDFGSGELRARLVARGFDPPAVAATVAGLLTRGVVNDARYADNFVAYHAARGQGPARIAAELRRHGVAQETISGALAGGPDWRLLARKVCQSKFGPEPPKSWAQKARQARFLQYRGFSADHIRAATGADSDVD
jgi:regulatory protein